MANPSPNRIDRNASSLNRLRRNMQRLTLGAATSTIAVDPAGGISTDSSGLTIVLNQPSGLILVPTFGLSVNPDSSTIAINNTTNQIGVVLAPNGGLVSCTAGLTIKLADNSLSTGGPGIKVRTGNGLSTGANLRVLVDGSTVSFNNSSVAVQLNDASIIYAATNLGGLTIGYGSTSSTLLSTNFATGIELVKQASTTVLAGPSTGGNATPTFRPLASTDIPSLPSTLLPSDVAYTDVANTFTSTQTVTQSLIVSTNLLLANSTHILMGGVPAIWGDLSNNSIAIGNAGNSTGFGQFNVAIGDQAMATSTSGTLNVAIGFQALTSNTTGFSNVAIGQGALASNTTGLANFALGDGALSSNTNGFSNLAIGHNALQLANTSGALAIGAGALGSLTSGSGNLAVGVNALLSNTSGSENTAVGDRPLFSNTTGGGNVAVGGLSLFLCTGNNNTAYGTSAAFHVTAGASNVGVGASALGAVSTGSFNIHVGNYMTSGAGFTTGSNNIQIGHDQQIYAASTSNTLNIGNLIFGTNVQTGATIAGGNVGINTPDQFGSGLGVIGIANAGTIPTTNPSGGGVLFVSTGALCYRGSSGTVTVIAPA